MAHPLTPRRVVPSRRARSVALMLAALAVSACGTDRSAHRDGSSTDSVVDTTAVATTVDPAGTTTLTTPAPTTTKAPTSSSTAIQAGGAGGLGALAGRTIAVDPGHNGQNFTHAAEINQLVDIGTKMKECDTTGTSTDAGYTESTYNLDVARRLVAVLQGAGAQVVLTRSDDNGWGPCINERAAIGNRAGADAAISIHADGGPADGRGFHVIYPVAISGLTDRIAGPSQQLAVAVRDAFAAGTGMPYSTYLGSAALSARDDLGGLNLSTVPKVFIETGNMRNASDVGLLTDPSFRQREAESIAAGLAVYLAGR